jgi:hypothetical protein
MANSGIVLAKANPIMAPANRKRETISGIGTPKRSASQPQRNSKVSMPTPNMESVAPISAGVACTATR